MNGMRMREKRRSRRWRTAILILVPAVCLLAGTGLIAATGGDGYGALDRVSQLAGSENAAMPTNTMRAPGVSRDGPLPTATATPTSPPTATPVPEPTPTPAPPRAASPAGLRLWSDGDSTSYFMSVAVIDLLSAQGAIPVQAAPEYKISSGLLTPGYFDWPGFIASEMAATDADIVVFMVGANDAHAGIDLVNYATLVGGVMDQLQRPGRVVAWVGQPAMGPDRPDLNAAIPGMNAAFAQEAAKRPWVTYVDAWALTTDADGHYAESLPDENGEYQLLRASDGVHFTSAGGRRLALGVVHALFP